MVSYGVGLQQPKGRGFDSQPFHRQVATLGKLFTHMRPGMGSSRTGLDLEDTPRTKFCGLGLGLGLDDARP